MYINYFLFIFSRQYWSGSGSSHHLVVELDKINASRARNTITCFQKNKIPETSPGRRSREGDGRGAGPAGYVPFWI